MAAKTVLAVLSVIGLAGSVLSIGLLGGALFVVLFVLGGVVALAEPRGGTPPRPPSAARLR